MVDKFGYRKKSEPDTVDISCPLPPSLATLGKAVGGSRFALGKRAEARLSTGIILCFAMIVMFQKFTPLHIRYVFRCPNFKPQVAKKRASKLTAFVSMEMGTRPLPTGVVKSGCF